MTDLREIEYIIQVKSSFSTAWTLYQDSQPDFAREVEPWRVYEISDIHDEGLDIGEVMVLSTKESCLQLRVDEEWLSA